VRTSGYTAYDLAAIDVAFQAGPYPDPPRAIRSANGKIYVHWRFYRDERQCATSGVDYFILDNPPTDGDKASMARAEAGGVGGEADRPRAGGRRRGGDRSWPRPAAPGAEPRRGRASPPGGLPRAVGEELPPRGPRRPRPQVFPPRSTARSARAAESWFDACSRGDIAAMLGPAVYPFRSSNGNAAGKRSTLETMLRGLVDESDADARTIASMQMVSPAGLRGIIGRLPPGLDDGSGGLYAVARTVSNDTLILILTRKGADWKVAGLARR
jgi:hypothetical protein